LLVETGGNHTEVGNRRGFGGISMKFFGNVRESCAKMNENEKLENTRKGWNFLGLRMWIFDTGERLELLGEFGGGFGRFLGWSWWKAMKSIGWKLGKSLKEFDY
jgi:hypothetical protein